MELAPKVAAPEHKVTARDIGLTVLHLFQVLLKTVRPYLYLSSYAAVDTKCAGKRSKRICLELSRDGSSDTRKLRSLPGGC